MGKRLIKKDENMIKIGNAPCSWGVEFADDARNPAWTTVLKENAYAGYKGIELGPVGFMPEDASVLAEELAKHDQTLIGGVVFRAFHDPAQWDDVLDGATRTCIRRAVRRRLGGQMRPSKWTLRNGPRSGTALPRSLKWGLRNMA